jgi:hypothetical protein
MSVLQMGSAPQVIETPLGSGFRRTSPMPPPTAVARLRALLLATARGQSNSVREGLAKLDAWENLPLLMHGPWFGVAGGAGVTARRSLQRRLRLLGTRAISVADAAAVPRGQPVTIIGKAKISPGKKLGSYIWTNRRGTTGNVRLLVEEGHDFFVMDESSGRAALVASCGGHLIAGDRVVDGDRVEVFGFMDYVVDPRAPGGAEAGDLRAFAREPPSCLSIRSGDELTLIVRKV